MSAKDDKKKGKKDKDKDKEKERLMEEEAKREKQRQEAQDRIQVLEKSGILDAYEYFLRAICKNGLPEANVFEFAAQQILKYQKKIKLKQGARREELPKSPERQGPIDRSVEKSRALPAASKDQKKK